MNTAWSLGRHSGSLLTKYIAMMEHLFPNDLYQRMHINTIVRRHQVVLHTFILSFVHVQCKFQLAFERPYLYRPLNVISVKR